MYFCGDYWIDWSGMESLLKELEEKHGIRFSQGEKSALLQGDFSALDMHFLRDVISVAVDEIGLGKSAAAAVLLRNTPIDIVKNNFDEQTIILAEGLRRVDELYKIDTSLETENFRQLLLTLAEDVRVVLIIIAERAALMRKLNTQGDSEYRQKIAKETSFLYTPLAHRLGLYTIKTEFEDLSLKFTDYETYKTIAKTLNETKQHRDAYIDAFIGPLKEKLEQQGFKFHIKGRTKSIHSIYNKMQKQNTTVDHI